MRYFSKKYISAQEAVSKIRSGDRVVIGHACGEPSYLVDAMVDNAAQYRNVEIVHMVAMGKCAYCQPGMEPYFRHNAIFAGGGSRRAIAEGRADFTPSFFFQVPQLFGDSLPIDVALVQVTPPKENGVSSLGVSADYTVSAVKNAKLVIAQVNDQMPYTYGDTEINVSELDFLVEQAAPLIPLALPKIGEVEQAIGANCASLIRDGDTLQLGIGAIPDAVLQCLGDKKDLGIHSEMFSDGVVALAQAGVINNKAKNLHPDKFVATFLMGTQRLYNFVDKNPDVLMRSVDYVNHPMIAAQNDNLVSINSCVQVDLMGQIASETIGYTQISGVGGQVDFIRAAALSRGGRAIIAIPSRTKGISKIVPLLDEGAAVTTSRNDADYVVTEYGIAKLKGQTLRQRAKQLIAIAHPDFRPDLTEVWERRFGEKWPDASKSKQVS